MADGRVEAAAGAMAPKRSLWSDISRTFPVALDPRKLLLAAVGIFVMSLGWYVLSAVFAGKAPDKDAAEYGAPAMQKSLGDTKSDGKPYPAEEYAKKGEEAFKRDDRQWKALNELAGEGGKLRTMPWNENRGDNPFLIATDSAGGSLSTKFLNYLADQIPVVTEPLSKLFLLVFKLIDPNVTFLTRVYVLLCLLWSVAVWAYFGGVITRIAAVQFGGKDRVTLKQAMRFVSSRYTAYVLSPLVPLIIVGFIVFAMSLYGLFALIPVVGDVFLYGLGLPLIILGGIVMSILLIGLIGYPLMYSTISTEGSDTFDALSRSYNYVFQAPWAYLWNWLVAVVYGAAVTFVVILIGCMMVYLGKWAVSVPASVLYSERKPDFLFVYAPESLGWKELLLKGSDAAIEWKDAPVVDGKVVNPTGAAARVKEGRNQLLVPTSDESNKAYRDDLRIHNKIGAGLATFWMILIFLMMIGFTYSYFWSAAAMIYLLMRKKVDEVDMEEVYIEDEAVPPVGPPPVPPAPMSPPAPTFSLPTVPPPAYTPPVPPAPPAPVPPAPVPPPAPAWPPQMVPDAEAKLPPPPVADEPKLP